MDSEIKELLRELDLEPGADLSAVRESYRQLVKVWHPDRFGNDKKLQAIANDKLKKINFAHHALVTLFEKGGKAHASKSQKAESPSRTSKVPTAGEIYRSGVVRYYQKDYKGAAHYFLQTAELGHAEGQYAMGFILYHHSPRNFFTTHKVYAEAFDWWQKAAVQGNSNAQYMLGIFYQYAICRPYDGTEARKWFERAASSGHSLAIKRLNFLGRVLNTVHSIRAVPLTKWFMEAPPGAPMPD